MSVDVAPDTADLATACKVAIAALAPAAKAGAKTKLAEKYEREWLAEIRRRAEIEEQAREKAELAQRKRDEAKRAAKRERDRRYRERRRAEREAQRATCPACGAAR